MKLNILWPTVESTIKYIRSRGKPSFRHALLRSVKSTHIATSRLAYSRVLHLRAIRGSGSLWLIWLLIVRQPLLQWLCYFSILKLIFLCLTGCIFGQTLNRCSVNFSFIPGMSSWLRAKISWFDKELPQLLPLSTFHSGSILIVASRRARSTVTSLRGSSASPYFRASSSLVSTSCTIILSEGARIRLLTTEDSAILEVRGIFDRGLKPMKTSQDQASKGPPMPKRVQKAWPRPAMSLISPKKDPWPT